MISIIKKILLGGVLFLILTLHFWQPEKIGFYNNTNSAPKGYYVIQNKETFERSQYVIISIPPSVEPLTERGWMKPQTPLLKQIGALPGDTVTISDEGIFINKVYHGPAYTHDREGKPLPQIRDTFTIRPGYFLPLCPYSKSFDGRYFGSVPISSIEYSVVPLFTW